MYIRHLRNTIIMQTGYLITCKANIKASAAKVWEALTDPNIVKQYFFGSGQETDWREGSPIFWKGEYEGHPFSDKGEVLQYEPVQRLSYSYLSSFSGLEDKPENYLVVTYELFEENGSTRLEITQSNYDEEKAAHCEENWRTVIDGLKKIVE